LLDESLPPDTMSARSATEIAERMKELAQNLGSAFGRLISETMQPLVSVTLQILDERGLVDMPLKVNGLEVKVAPVSPIAQAQSMEEINKVVTFLQIAQQLGPEGAMAVSRDRIADFIADKLGVAAELRTTPDERAAMQQQMQQAAQMAVEAQSQGVDVAGAVKALA
jgi:hypothetical protein